MIYDNSDYEKNITNNDKMNPEYSTQDQHSSNDYASDSNSTSGSNSAYGSDPAYSSSSASDSNSAYGSDSTSGSGSASGKHKRGGKRPGLRYMKKAIAAVSLGIIFGGCSVGGAYAVSQFTGSSFLSSGTNETQSATTNTETSPSASNAVADKDTEQTVTTTSSTDTKTVTTDVTNVVSAAMPSIVSIDNNYTETVTSMFGQSGEEEATASGSGIIVGKSDTELLIVTNNHVVEDSDTLNVTFIDDTEAEADIKGTDSDLDLAVIAVQLSDLTSDTLGNISVATLGDSDSLQVGEPAIAIGNALGYGQSVTTGVISAVNREIELSDNSTGTFIQTDAAINPGNSGGALLNSNGEVIGINSNKIGGTTIEGMGYAIPISTAQPIIDKLMNESTKEKVDDSERGGLGVSVMTPTGVEGAYVAAVEDDSAAAQGGIEAGDLITKIDDTEITSRDDLENALKYYSKGTKVTITVLRRGDSGYQEETLNVTLQAAASTSSSSDGSTTDATSGATPKTGDSGSAANYMPEDGNSQSIFGNMN